LALSFGALLGTTEHTFYGPESYRVEHILASLSQDGAVQQHTRAVCDFLEESVETVLTNYGTRRNAPDGIHRILVSYDGGIGENEHFFLIKNALLETQTIKPEDQSIGFGFLHIGALQRSLKIRQIVNTILPPVIQDQEESGKVVLHDTQESGNTFLPVNSFYLQANIGERQIEFILNKVVKAPLSKTPVELFTAQEQIIEMDDILTATSNILWNHYQLLESEGCLNTFISCCQEHKDIELSLGHYERFTASMTSLINRWVRMTSTCKKECLFTIDHTQFQNKSILSTEELDAEELISINKECTCALKTTHRTLLETGLKPAISSIAEIIVGTTLSNDHFGLYTISAVFVKGCVDFINNVYCADYLQRYFKERTRRILQTHRRKLTMILVDEDTEAEMRQYMARGNYTQTSNSTYSISFEVETLGGYFSLGLLDDHLLAYASLSGKYSQLHMWSKEHERLFKSGYTILRKGEHLPSTGVKRLFFLPFSCIKYAKIGKLPLIDYADISMY